MFDQLFGSKTRVKLLSLFLNNPERSFYVREITRKIDEQINSVRRELSNLLSIGIIHSDGANNRLYYQANQKYQYYPELRKIFSTIPIKSRVAKDTKEDDQIATKLRTTGSITLAFLTGTFVRQPQVSIDLLVVGDVNKARMSKAVTEIEKELGHEINYAVFTPEDYQYRLDLNDRFLSNVMDSKRITIIDASRAAQAGPALQLPVDAEPVMVKQAVAVADAPEDQDNHEESEI